MVEEEKKTKKKVNKTEVPKAEKVKVETPAHSTSAPAVTPVTTPVAAEAPQKAKRKGKAKKEKTKVRVARGKRKLSVARATVKPGKGVIRVNRMNVTALNNHYVRAIIVEPLRYLGPEANGINISVTVTGGGMLGQAQAARTAIANALSEYFEDMNLKDKFVAIDRSLIVEDTRRVESKKYRGPKARARFQKSYR